MKLILIGDRLFGTSAYSKVATATCKIFQDYGHEVAYIPIGRANNMGISEADGIKIFTSGQDVFAEDVAIKHYTDFKADMLFTIKENSNFNKIYNDAINYCPFIIIDHKPVSGVITSRLANTFRNIVPSRFGQLQLKKRNINSTYIPHGTYTDVFKPFPDQKKHFKKVLGIPEDTFIVGDIGMNRIRKFHERTLRGYKRFRENNPDAKDARLLLWTDVQPRQLSGDVTHGVSDLGTYLIFELIDLGIENEVIGKPTDRNVTIPDNHLNPNEPDMVKLYNVLDYHLLASGGEGFGLTLIEAEACGVPCGTTDYAAGPEQLGSGWLIKSNDYVLMNTGGMRYALADIDSIAESIEKAYNCNSEKMSRRARRYALRYDWSNVAKRYWKPFLDDCVDDLYPKLSSKGKTTWRS